MIDAKGLGYAEWLIGPNAAFMQGVFQSQMRDQAFRQVQAAGTRELESHFAEKQAADATRELFRSTIGLRRIKVDYDFWQEGIK